jgi:two-component system CheB/CheR fusion protein
LRRDLTTALHKAAGIREIVRCPGLRVKTNGGFATVNLTVRPVPAGPAATLEAPLYLVVLEEAPPFAHEPAQPTPTVPAGAGADGSGTDADARIAALEQELRAKEEYLQTTHEELETANEELKSSNECVFQPHSATDSNGIRPPVPTGIRPLIPTAFGHPDRPRRRGINPR